MYSIALVSRTRPLPSISIPGLEKLGIGPGNEATSFCSTGYNVILLHHQHAAKGSGLLLETRQSLES